MYVCMCVTYAYVCVYTYIMCLCVHYEHMCVHICLYIMFLCLRMYVCMRVLYVCLRMFMYGYVYTSVYICTGDDKVRDLTA
jgi:hypothetical protein